jgi:HEAT repeat protein
VTSRHLLAIIAVIQGITLALLVVLILFNRGVRDRQRAGVRPRRAALDEAMRAWTLADGPAGLGTVMTRLSRLPTNAAIDALVAWSARLPADRWQALAAKVTELRWAAAVRSWFTARQWWRRLQAARLLSVAATPADEPLLVALLGDSHSAVYIAAAGAIERFESPTLVRAALDRLPTLPTTVRAYYAALLRRVHAPVAAMLKERLARTDDAALPVFAEFAARLGDPALREALTGLAGHGNAEVRVQVARALGGFPHPNSVVALHALGNDALWEVRAQAIRALGRIADPSSLTILRERLRDSEWWVRLRAALGLTRFGRGGHDALLAAETGANADARYVSRLILGLSPQALAEFAA